MKILAVVLLSVSLASAQDSRGNPVTIVRSGGVGYCLCGPYFFQSLDGVSVVEAPSTGYICWQMRGKQVWLADFGSGVFAVNEFGEVQILAEWLRRDESGGFYENVDSSGGQSGVNHDIMVEGSPSAGEELNYHSNLTDVSAITAGLSAIAAQEEPRFTVGATQEEPQP